MSPRCSQTTERPYLFRKLALTDDDDLACDIVHEQSKKADISHQTTCARSLLSSSFDDS